MEHNPWNYDIYLSGEGIPAFLKFERSLQSLLYPLVNQLNPFHTFTPCPFKIHFNIILPITSRYPLYFFQIFRHKFYKQFLYPYTFPSHHFFISSPSKTLKIKINLWYYPLFWAGIAQSYSAGLRVRWSGFESRQGLGIFLFTTASRTDLWPAQSPIQWLLGALSLGVKRPVCEADHSPPYSAQAKNSWSCTSTPNMPLWRGA
jgi:hypothetical protein